MALEFIDSTSAYEYSASGDFNIPAANISLTCLHAETNQTLVASSLLFIEKAMLFYSYLLLNRRYKYIGWCCV
jgi:hypothetical protein